MFKPIKRESGALLFIILMCIVAFAALSYAVRSSVNGGSSKGPETETQQLDEGVSEQYASLLENTAMRLMVVNGCAESQISYETPEGNNANPLAPADKHCHIFDAAGGGISWQGDYTSSSCNLTTLSPGADCDGTVYIGLSQGSRAYTTVADTTITTWNNGDPVGIDTSSSSDTDGATNTTHLLSLTGYPDYPFKAAVACRNLGSDWYLPAIDELADLDAAVTSGYISAAGRYWSSSKSNTDTTKARARAFGVHVVSGRGKSQYWNVRCMRRD